MPFNRTVTQWLKLTRSVSVKFFHDFYCINIGLNSTRLNSPFKPTLNKTLLKSPGENSIGMSLLSEAAGVICIPLTLAPPLLVHEG